MYLFSYFNNIILFNFFTMYSGPTEILEINSIICAVEIFFLLVFIFFRFGFNISTTLNSFKSHTNSFSLEIRYYTNTLCSKGMLLTVYYENYDSYSHNAVSSAFSGDTSFMIIDSLFKFIYSFFSKRGNKTTNFFPIISFLFFAVLFFSLSALIPISEIFISSVFSIFFISTVSLLFILFYSIINYQLNFLFFFLPIGSPKYLLKFLIIVELLSYLARAVSLPARLVANSAAGHLLIKILLGFSCLAYIKIPAFLKFIMYLPIHVCIFLLCLDILIIFLQTFVFIFLLSFYLNQAVYTGAQFVKNKKFV